MTQNISRNLAAAMLWLCMVGEGTL